MKNLLMIGLSCILLLSACSPNFEQEQEVVQETDSKKEKAIIPRYNISESFYRTILPFKEGEARGLVASNLNTRLDIDEFETGLMRIAQDTFPADKYLYQEGQYIDRDTIQAWLNRKWSPEQLKAHKKEEEDNIGLNPIFDEADKTSYEERMKNSPIYLAHILEHNYLIKNNEGKVQLGGVVIGLALNSVHYYNLPAEQGGYPREVKVDGKTLEAEGKRIADEVIKRLRTNKKFQKLNDVPITIALFKQEEVSSIVPGNIMAKATIDSNNATIEKWEDVNEEYHFFPSTAATEAYPDDAMIFGEFIADIDEYFPNYTAVIGRGFYKNDELRELTITIPMQFYGKAEVIGFTQYITGLVMERFENYFTLQVYISSESGPEAIIVREAGSEKPFVHVYN